MIMDIVHMYSGGVRSELNRHRFSTLQALFNYALSIEKDALLMEGLHNDDRSIITHNPAKLRIAQVCCYQKITQELFFEKVFKSKNSTKG